MLTAGFATGFIYSIITSNPNGIIATAPGFLILPWIAWNFLTGLRVEPGRSIGGGAFLFRKVVKQAFGSHEFLEVKEPMFANVRGYQIAGVNHVAAAPGAGSAVEPEVQP